MNQDLPQTPDFMPEITAMAVGVEEKIDRLLSTFEMAGARLYGVNSAGRPAEEPNLCFLAQHPDVYELLESPSSSLARMFDGAAIVTTGWAAPLGPGGSVEGAPSEHASRRRVRLSVVVADHGVASVLRFADQPDDVITDPGSATGSLADAITHFWFDPPINLPTSAS